MAEVNPKARVNLERAVTLLLDDNPEGISILVQIVTAFGIKTLHRCTSIEAAQEVAGQYELDLIVANANMRDSSGYDFVSWLRRVNLEPNSFTPAIILTGHTQVSNVRKARDCGANFIVAKPVSPSVLLERILWVARESRPFVACDTYVGPDRRYRDVGPPEGVEGRRREDKLPKAAAPSPPAEQSVDVPEAQAKAVQ